MKGTEHNASTALLLAARRSPYATRAAQEQGMRRLRLEEMAIEQVEREQASRETEVRG